MQIGQCSFEINVTTLEARETQSIDTLIEQWLEDNDERFVISMDIQRFLNPGYGFIVFATIVHRGATLKELGVE